MPRQNPAKTPQTHMEEQSLTDPALETLVIGFASQLAELVIGFASQLAAWEDGPREIGAELDRRKRGIKDRLTEMGLGHGGFEIPKGEHITFKLGSGTLQGGGD